MSKRLCTTIRLASTLPFAIALFMSCGCGTQPANESISTATPNFAEHVAPIVFDNCTVCHRDGASGPFPLVTFDDVRRHGQQIVDVTTSRYMPPWLPGDGDHAFAGDRRLTKTQIETLQRWVKADMPAGDENRTPKAPVFSDEWMLGTPDWIGEMEAAYIRPAQTTDSWRNLVIPLDISETRYVRAYDFDPGNHPAVHHAVIQLDHTGMGRKLDDADPGLGFDGMQNGEVRLAAGSVTPDGQALGWTPGKVPYEGDDDIAWQVDSGDDLILQLHMPGSGKDESIRSRIALYFADRPPSKRPYSIIFALRDIEIPPGETNYRRQISYPLPVPIDMIGIYPHAHYVCEEMIAVAKLPDGTQQTLLHIPAWNFDWQDDYRFEKPISLPRGTILEMDYRYNNSTSNVRNPNNPPKHISYGESSSAAMGDLMFQVIAKNDQDRALLVSDYRRHQVRRSLDKHRSRVAKDPTNARAHIGAGEAHFILGQWAEARTSLLRGVELGDANADTYAKIAATHLQEKNLGEYLRVQQKTIELAPENAAFRLDYALRLQMAGKHADALNQYLALLKRNPDQVVALTNAGMLHGRFGKLEQSEKLLRRAVELAPDFPAAHANFGITLRNLKKYDLSIQHLQTALRLDPRNAATRKALESARNERQRKQLPKTE